MESDRRRESNRVPRAMLSLAMLARRIDSARAAAASLEARSLAAAAACCKGESGRESGGVSARVVSEGAAGKRREKAPTFATRWATSRAACAILSARAFAASLAALKACGRDESKGLEVQKGR